MKKMYRTRLYKHADFLESLPKPEKFNILDWANKIDEDKGIFFCNTVACVAGWAGLNPAFRRAGLKTVVCENIMTLDGVSMHPEDAAAQFFGLTRDESTELFYYQGYDVSDYQKVTAKVAAAKCREIADRHKDDVG
jgi:hypothetical protein